VIGTTGSGKSTFSQLLASRLGYPYIQLDQLFWKPGWLESNEEEFLAKVAAAVSAECWVLDGNYSRTNHIKWENVDTIIWVDYSYPRTLLQLLKRTLSRSILNKELWPGTGNRESFARSFLSKDSILIWFFKNYHQNKIRYAELGGSLGGQIEFVRLRNPKEARAFLDNIEVVETLT